MKMFGAVDAGILTLKTFASILSLLNKGNFINF